MTLAARAPWYPDVRRRARDWVRARPVAYLVFRVLKYGPFMGYRRQGVRRRLLERSARDGWRVLNLGSGGRPESAAINLDVTCATGPDVVADGYRLPFADGTFDAVFCEYVIEHVEDPDGFLRSARRVLKPNGRIYLEAPFLQPLHGKGGDYTRWTRPGFAAFAERAGLTLEDSGIHAGPAFTLFWIVKDLLADLLSLGRRPLRSILRYVLSWILAPVLLLDLVLMRLPQAEVLANGFYFVAVPCRDDEAREVG